MKKIEIQRTPGEREAYLQGFQAGLQASNDTLLVFKTIPYTKKEEQQEIYDRLLNQVSNGIVLIGSTVDLVYAGQRCKVEVREK